MLKSKKITKDNNKKNLKVENLGEFKSDQRFV